MKAQLNIKKSSTTVNGIDFTEIPENLSNSFLSRMIAILDWDYNLVNFNPSWNIVNFDNDRKLYNIAWNTFVIEYIDSWKRDNDKKILDRNFKSKWLFSEELENWRQVPETSWCFEYNWKSYLILEARNETTSENSESLYNWVIINSSLYFWLSENSKEVVNDTVWEIDSILNRE